MSAGIKMLKKIKKTPFNITVLSVTFISMVTFSIFAVSFSSIFYILIFGSIGLLVYSLKQIRIKEREDKK